MARVCRRSSSARWTRGKDEISSEEEYFMCQGNWAVEAEIDAYPDNSRDDGSLAMWRFINDRMPTLA